MSDSKGGDLAAASATLNSGTSILSGTALDASAANSNGRLSPAAADGAAAKTEDDSGDSSTKGNAADAKSKDRAASLLGDSAADREDAAQDDVQDDADDEDAAELDTVAANDVKNIILQILSPYFDDDAGTGADVVGADALGGVAAGAAGNAAASPAGSPNLANRDVAGMPGATPSPSSPTGQEEEAGEDVAQRYDHVKSEMWIARICDGIMERLVGLGKPFKFVVHTMIMRKCGAGLHVCSSCYYAPSDGWLSHSHDLSAHLYAVVTVYWCAM